MYILIIAKYLCTFCVYMYVHVGGCTYTFVHAVTRGSCHRSLCSSPPYFFGTGFLTESGTHQDMWPGLSSNSRGPPISASPGLRL